MVTVVCSHIIDKTPDSDLWSAATGWGYFLGSSLRRVTFFGDSTVQPHHQNIKWFSAMREKQSNVTSSTKNKKMIRGKRHTLTQDFSGRSHLPRIPKLGLYRVAAKIPPCHRQGGILAAIFPVFFPVILA